MSGINTQAAISGESEMVRDMIECHEADGLPIHWEASLPTLENLADRPAVRYTQEGAGKLIEASFVAGWRSLGTTSSSWLGPRRTLHIFPGQTEFETAMQHQQWYT